jgi:hypothetical protein
VRIFCCDRNGALSKKLQCYRKKKIAKIKFLMVTKKSYKTTRLGAKNLGKLANFAKYYREKFDKLASSCTG